MRFKIHEVGQQSGVWFVSLSTIPTKPNADVFTGPIGLVSVDQARWFGARVGMEVEIALFCEGERVPEG